MVLPASVCHRLYSSIVRCLQTSKGAQKGGRPVLRALSLWEEFRNITDIHAQAAQSSTNLLERCSSWTKTQGNRGIVGVDSWVLQSVCHMEGGCRTRPCSGRIS